MRAMTLLAAVALLALPAAAHAGGAEAPNRPIITLDRAMRVIEAARAEAQSNGWRAVIAVVDDGGWLIALQRMDDPSMLASVELAPGKARTAALFRKPTAALEAMIDHGRFAAVTALGAVEMQGGIPLQIAGRVVGAIGVSADTPAHDQQIAEAGARALDAP